MRKIFLDTSYLLALIRKKDARHEDALTASANDAGPFITTDLVLVELANCLSQPPYRATVVAVIEKIRTDRNTMVVPFGSEGMEKAFSLYRERPDKAWGLVDCFSFVVMKEKRLKVALCFDEHFRQAGFETPLLAR
ncbi:MAG: PIN domain-containing protein [Syntrophus sp. (in: bacteria)]